MTFLIRGNDRTFTDGFDAVFEAHGTRIVRTPIQSPEANGIAERFVRTARSECLDWLLIVNAQHLERTLTVFIDHYSGWRPHRSLDLVPPNGRPSPVTRAETQPIEVKRRDRLGGRIHEYERTAYVGSSFCTVQALLRGHKRPPDADDYCLALA